MSSSSTDFLESTSSSSSSSDSSDNVWSRAKPLVLANSAVSTATVLNRLAQTITVNLSHYSIDKIYCHLMGAYGENNNFKIHLGVYECNDDGEPSVLLQLASLNGEDITSNGWYAFDFNLDAETPDNKFLSFVMWQEDGDESNYAMWSYSLSENISNIAWISNDGINWTEDDGVSRSLRIIQNSNMFNLDKCQIETLPAEEKELQFNFNERNPEYIDTKIDLNENLVLDYPPMAISFVIDNSGSMGWNDRFKNRKDIITEMISKIKNQYPSDFLFDFVSFGSKIADPSISDETLGEVITINIDANLPDRATYEFIVPDDVSINEGDIYSHNGNLYTISKSESGTKTIICYGDGVPLDSGTLSKPVSPNIYFTSYKAIGISDKMVAYGFKSLGSSNSYTLGNLKLNDIIISQPSTKNWWLYHPISESPSLSLCNDGPNDSPAIDLTSSNGVIARKHFSNSTIKKTNIVSDVLAGDTIIKVEDSSVFNALEIVDITDGDEISVLHTITGINSTLNELLIDPPLSCDIKGKDNGNGVVESNGSSYSISLSGTTFKLLIKTSDPIVPIIFFLQNSNGWTMEWDITPHSEWFYSNLYYINQTALLPISVFDKDGEPFADGTKVALEVGVRKELVKSKTINEYDSQLTREANVGDTIIYVESIEGYDYGMSIDIIGGNNIVQNLTITQIATGIEDFNIEFAEALMYDFGPSNNARIVTNNKKTSFLSNNEFVPISLSMVDVTPVETGVALDNSLLQEHDGVPIPPSLNPNDLQEKESIYDSINDNIEVTKFGTVDIPTINGYAFARVLPVTEDFLQTALESDSFSELILRGSPKSVVTDQIEQTTGDINASQRSLPDESIEFGDGHSIETPVILRNGYAESAMRTTSTDFTLEEIPNYNIPGVPSPVSLLMKTYDIYPQIIEELSNGQLKATQYFDKFVVNFISPINIYSSLENVGTVDFYCEKIVEDENGCKSYQWYQKVEAYGSHYGESEFTIDYIVSNQGSLIQSGNLNIKIYSNELINLENWVSKNIDELTQDAKPSQTKEYINYKKTDGSVLSDIGTWRANVESAENITSSNEIDDPDQNQFYANVNGWKPSADFDSYNLSIPIVNGKATLTLPSIDKEAMLLVEASYEINSDYEFICSNLIMIRSPLMITGINPYTIVPTGYLEDRYEIGVEVTWMDGKYGTIEDKTNVKYISTTESNPSISVTSDGWAGGIFLGPKSKIVVQDDPSSLCDVPPTLEQIEITIEHSSGLSKKIIRNIYWKSEVNVSVNEFFFRVISGSVGWSDGSLSSIATISSDLNDGYNQLNSWVGVDGIAALMGHEQPYGTARTVNATNRAISPFYPNWANGSVIFSYEPYNLSLGYHPVQGPELDSKYYSPWDISVSMATNYYDNQGNIVQGKGLEELPVPEGDSFYYPLPVFSFKEPLRIDMEIENSYVRDGVTHGIIVADVKWKDKPIYDSFIINEGLESETTIYYPSPSVTFLAGKFNGLLNATDELIPQYKDYRGKFGCSLDVTPNNDVKLSTYIVKTSLSRTSKYESIDLSSIHTHACSVDSLGNGVTESTITLQGINVPSHTHTIVNFQVDASQYGLPAEIHVHTLRSVAIADLLPTLNSTIEMSIIGIAEYDPTNAQPYTESKSGVGLVYPKNGNRMMFDSIRLNPLGGSFPTEPKLILELTCPDMPANVEVPTYYAAEDILDTSRGFNIMAKAYFTEYYQDDGFGGYIIIPEKEVDDGSRIIININAYLPSPTDETDSITESLDRAVITGAGIKRHYILLSVDANITSEGMSAYSNIQVAIDSVLEWLPGYSALTPSLTSDMVYINKAIDNIYFMGSSSIYDAVRFSARRIIAYADIHPEINDYKKAIILFTDGSQNKSEYSLDQAINMVKQIDPNYVPIIPVRLGTTYSSDSIILSKMHIETNGFDVNSFNIPYSSVPSLVNYIFEHDKWIVGRGTYSNVAEIETLSILKKVFLENVTTSGGTNVLFRYRTSANGDKWGLWSQWHDYTNAHDVVESLDAKVVYVEYEIKLIGDSDFNSPIVEKDISLTYLEPKPHFIFFNEISIGGGSSEAFVSSIHITHEADFPLTSMITYGITQNEISNDESYYSTINPDEHTIILTRYNETMVTSNYKVYKAINGKWPNKVKVDVYRLNSRNPNVILVNPSDYSSNNIEGIISFYSGQPKDDKFVICIEVNPWFRLVCKVVNYGSESAIIHHIGIVYNMMKRIPTDNNGTIIHTPINSRI